jgi:protein O-GlcNAc transferase
MNIVEEAANMSATNASTSVSSSEKSMDEALRLLFQLAQTNLVNGDLQKALECYQLILQHAPDDARANYGVGLLLQESETPLEGLPYLEAAIQSAPTVSAYWDTYIEILRVSNDPELISQALELRRQFIPSMDKARPAPPTESPASADPIATTSALPVAETVAKNESIVKAELSKSASKQKMDDIAAMVRLHEAENFVELERFSKKILRKKPNHLLAKRFLGLALLALNQPKEAMVQMKAVLAYGPNDAVSHFNLAQCYLALNDFPQTEVHLRAAMRLDPELLVAKNNFGNLLIDLGRVDEAIECFTQLTLQAPDYFLGHLNLANAYVKKERFDIAKEHAEKSLNLSPENVQALLTSACILTNDANAESDQLAVKHIEHAISLNPHNALAYATLASLFFKRGDYLKARQFFQKSIELDPKDTYSYSLMGSIARQHRASIGEAETYFRTALEFDPTSTSTRSALLFLLSEQNTLSQEELFKEHCLYGHFIETPVKNKWPAHTNSKEVDRRLRVGFVSGDLCLHVVATFFMPVLRQLFLDESLMLFAYDNSGEVDVVRDEFKFHFHSWTKIDGSNDDVAERAILNDQIDVLIDLSGHTAKNRLPLFARKPAPIQISWIGYPGTTGLQAMDYFITDRYCLPEGQFDHLFTEKLLRLTAIAPFTPYEQAPDVTELPALKNGYVTFASFNRPSKISDEVLDVWATVLREIPTSKMILGGMTKDMDCNYLVNAFGAKGIDATRLTFFERSEMPIYLDKLGEVDICLDTFPYNGGTTTLLSLWMGVPVVSKSGVTVAARTGAGLLSHVGMEHLVTNTNEDFVREALYMAEHLEELAALRQRLRQTMKDSVLLHPEWIAANLTKAIRVVWRRWCEGLPPVSIDVSEPNALESGATTVAEGVSHV